MLYAVKVYVAGRPHLLAVEAASIYEAVAQVRRRLGEDRATVVRVSPAQRGLSPRALPLWERVGPRDLELFCRRMQALISAGVTVLEALETVAVQSEKRLLREALAAVGNNVRAGFALSVAFRAYPRVFPAVFTNTVAAAEETGALGESMKRLAEHFSREAAFREKIRQAMAYPALVTCLAITLALGLFAFVVPRFATLLADAGVPLPAVTRLMLWAGGHALQVVLLLLGAAAAGLALTRTAGRRGNAQKLLARVPVFGKLFSRAAAARACRSMALMVRTGIPVVRALEIAGEVAAFAPLKEELTASAETVRGGSSLAASLSGSRWLPPTGVKMAAVGEASGRLDEMLEQAALLFETELDLLVQKLPPLIEAGMVIGVGGFVLLVLVSLLLPVISVYQTVQ